MIEGNNLGPNDSERGHTNSEVTSEQTSNQEEEVISEELFDGLTDEEKVSRAKSVVEGRVKAKGDSMGWGSAAVNHSLSKETPLITPELSFSIINSGLMPREINELLRSMKEDSFDDFLDHEKIIFILNHIKSSPGISKTPEHSLYEVVDALTRSESAFARRESIKKDERYVKPESGLGKGFVLRYDSGSVSEKHVTDQELQDRERSNIKSKERIFKLIELRDQLIADIKKAA